MSAPNMRRALVRRYIADYLAQYGIAPSVREIGRATGLKTPSAVHYHLSALEAAGELRRVPFLKRAITLLPQHPGKKREEKPSQSSPQDATRRHKQSAGSTKDPH